MHRARLTLGIAAAVAISCVPDAKLDPCERCPETCDRTSNHCLPEALADLDGPIASLAARGGEIVACVGPHVVDSDLEEQTETSAVRLVRYDNRVHLLADALGRGENCAGATYGAEGRAFLGVYGGPGQGVYRVLRDRDRAARIAPLRDVRDVATAGDEVLIAAGAQGREVFTGVGRIPVSGAETLAPIGATASLARMPTKILVEPDGRITWSIASTEEVLTKPSADGGAVEVVLDGRGTFPRKSTLRDFAVAGSDVLVILDALVLTVPRERPWAVTSIPGVDGEARLVADADAIYVAWWKEQRVERIDRTTSERSTLGSGIRGGVLALDDDALWIGESQGTRLLRVRLPTDRAR